VDASEVIVTARTTETAERGGASEGSTLRGAVATPINNSNAKTTPAMMLVGTDARRNVGSWRRCIFPRADGAFGFELCAVVARLQ